MIVDTARWRDRLSGSTGANQFHYRRLLMYQQVRSKSAGVFFSRVIWSLAAQGIIQYSGSTRNSEMLALRLWKQHSRN
jgi:hypothetical protein